jgi:glucokinase
VNASGKDILTIGIDIGGTNLRFALVNAEGRIISRSRLASGITEGREAFCRRLMVGISELRNVADAAGACIIGIGAGVPGLIGSDGVIHASVNMRALDGFNLALFLEQQTGLPAVCGNDANVIALGELIHGAGRGLSSFIVITIGTGLGSGLILDGQLWTGSHGFAAEFGHVTIEPEGLPCPCGNRGCLEQYVSAGAVVRFAGEHGIPEQLDSTDDVLDAAHVASLARQGQAAALGAFAEAGRCLGIAVASLANTLNLEAAIIGGGVAASLDLLLPSLNTEFARRCFPRIAEHFDIRAGALGDDAGLLGAAAMVRKRIEIVP